MEFLASGIPSRRDTRSARHASGRSPTPIFGKHTQQFYPASAIERWEKRLAKLATSRRTRVATGFLKAWGNLKPRPLNYFATLSCRSIQQYAQTTGVSISTENLIQILRCWRITLVPFGILYTSTTRHYLFSTTIFTLRFPPIHTMAKLNPILKILPAYLELDLFWD